MPGSYPDPAASGDDVTDSDEHMLTYEQWLRAMHFGAHARRSAARNAAFFLPHLRPGMTLLDAGCGPGSITLGLAEAVAPGTATGIDASTEPIEAASALAAERGVANVRFDVGDIHALPFEDASFDAAFVHAVLQHLPDPPAALRELRRVLKSGAVIGIADADLESGYMIHPRTPALDAALDLTVRLRVAGGGSPEAGRHLREWLDAAGFGRTTITAVADADGSADATARTAEAQAAYLEAPPFVAHVTSLGLATESELREIAAAWRAWGRAPGAFWVRLWYQAVGWVG
jgi:ubiquinone/menaquinone biosynthesis C-methylase UbiE